MIKNSLDIQELKEKLRDIHEKIETIRGHL